MPAFVRALDLIWYYPAPSSTEQEQNLWLIAQERNTADPRLNPKAELCVTEGHFADRRLS